MNNSISIIGGHVIDPKNEINGIKNIFINGDKITSNQSDEFIENSLVINAKGCLVLPGLIDFHSHIFFEGTDNSVPPDITMLPNCVTTAVDAGTAGTANYRSFHKNIICNSITRIKTFISMSPTGQSTNRYNENQDPKYVDEEKMELLFNEYPDELLGIKVRISKEIVKELGIEPLKKAIEIADKLNCSVAVHTTNPCCDTKRLIKLFRKGDIFAHVYHGTGSTIVGNDKHVIDEVKQARERGVIFDAANGKNHFSFDTCKAAFNDGFLPDVISSDFSSITMFKDPVRGLPWLMSKYIALGMKLVDVVAACTSTPAKLIGMEGKIGNLSEGVCADVAILKPIDYRCNFIDANDSSLIGEKLLLPQMTIRQGNIVFRQLNF